MTLLKWNKRVKLTSVVEPVEAARIHYLESLYATQFLMPHVQSIVDVGSGAGFPGLPIAAYEPNLTVVLVESQARKAIFLRLVAQNLGLRNLTVFHGRFQDYKPRDFDAALCRALDRFDEVLPEFIRFTDLAQQVLLFVGNELADKCRSFETDTWQIKRSPIPLSQQRFLLSLAKARST